MSCFAFLSELCIDYTRVEYFVLTTNSQQILNQPNLLKYGPQIRHTFQGRLDTIFLLFNFQFQSSVKVRLEKWQLSSN